MSPVVTNRMVNGSLDLNGWKSWADRCSSLLVSRSLCFPQCLATPVPAVGRCTGHQVSICYSPVKASDKGALGLSVARVMTLSLGSESHGCERALWGPELQVVSSGSSQLFLSFLVSVFTPFLSTLAVLCSVSCQWPRLSSYSKASTSCPLLQSRKF